MRDILLLCATDIGGARNLAPLAQLIQSKDHKCLFVASEISSPILDIQNVKVEKPAVSSSEDAIRYLTSKKPIAVICGTTRYIGAERFFTFAAKTLFIRSVAVLDEWFNYHLRFQDEKGNLTYLPDIICCQDEQAKKEAIAEGIPAHLLNITGSSSLSNLVDKVQQFVLHEPEIPDFLKSNGNVPVVTFLSETHAADYGNASGDQGPLGPYLGYTEFSVKEEVIRVLERLNRRVMFVEKLHPSADGHLGLHTEDHGKITVIKLKHTDFWPLLWHSDIVIGMRSMALLESIILGRPTVSFQPGLIDPEQCTAVRLGLIQGLSLSSELEDWCRQQLYITAAEKKKSMKRPPFARKDAAENIMRLAIEGI